VSQPLPCHISHTRQRLRHICLEAVRWSSHSDFFAMVVFRNVEILPREQAHTFPFLSFLGFPCRRDRSAPAQQGPAASSYSDADSSESQKSDSSESVVESSWRLYTYRVCSKILGSITKRSERRSTNLTVPSRSVNFISRFVVGFQIRGVAKTLNGTS